MLSPLNPSTYSTLGYVQTLTGDIINAMKSHHKALGINMVTLVIEQLINCVAPFPVEDDSMPMNQSMGETRRPASVIRVRSGEQTETLREAIYDYQNFRTVEEY